MNTHSVLEGPRFTLILATILLVAALSGCALFNKENSETNAEDTSAVETAEEAIVEGEGSEEVGADDYSAKDEAKDRQIDATAREDLSIKSCKEIQDTNDRWDCLEFVVITKARTGTDASLCNELREKAAAKESCLAQLGQDIITFPEPQNETDDSEEE